MNLTKLSIEEADVIFDILIENALWLASKNIFQWPIDWLYTIKSEIHNSISLGNFYSTNNDKITAVVEIKTEPEEIWSYDKEPSIYIHKLAICRKFKNQGLGTDIINKIKEKAVTQAKAFIRLDCVASNEKLRSYYQSCGFKFKREVEMANVSFALYEYDINNKFMSK